MTHASSRDWLSIREASRLLGVHIATLREWSDAGVLPSYRTPGGHRRFSALDLRSFLQRQQQHLEPTTPASPADHFIERMRHELRTHPLQQAGWFQQLSYNPGTLERAQQLEIGQSLVRCVVGFVENPSERDSLLTEGKRIARDYGRRLKANGLTAGNAARATISFRQLILDTTLKLHLGARTGDEEDAKLFQRVSSFVDEILLAMLDAYA